MISVNEISPVECARVGPLKNTKKYNSKTINSGDLLIVLIYYTRTAE